jgi:hypothetical protein
LGNAGTHAIANRWHCPTTAAVVVGHSFNGRCGDRDRGGNFNLWLLELESFMEKLIRAIVRSLPTNWLLVVNEESLDELDKRGEIIWADELPGNNQN